MGNPRIVEFRSERREAGLLVEGDGVHLCIQTAFGVTATHRLADQRSEERMPHAEAAPGRQHRHPADPTVGQQTPRPDGSALPIDGERVNARRVVLVPLERLRNALLPDEDVTAHRLQQRRARVPGRERYREERMVHDPGF